MARERRPPICTNIVPEQEPCQTVKRLFETTDEKFKPQHNATILSLQYWKLVRQCDDTVENRGTT